jgi:hypothetical protein
MVAMEVYLHAFVTSARDGDGWSGSRHDRFTPGMPLKAWMFVCVYSVFVQVAALRWADPPSKDFQLVSSHLACRTKFCYVFLIFHTSVISRPHFNNIMQRVQIMT